MRFILDIDPTTANARIVNATMGERDPVTPEPVRETTIAPSGVLDAGPFIGASARDIPLPAAQRVVENLTPAQSTASQQFGRIITTPYGGYFPQ
jgi:hypothetical protein